MKQKIKRGEDLFAQGNTKEAEGLFLSLLREGAKSAELYNDLAVIRFQSLDFTGAIEYLTLALELEPSHRDALVNCSIALRHVDKLQEALPLLEKAAEEHPEDEEVVALLQEARTRTMGRSKMAVLCLPGLTSFLGEIVRFFQGRYEVRTCFTSNRQEIDAAGAHDRLDLRCQSRGDSFGKDVEQLRNRPGGQFPAPEDTRQGTDKDAEREQRHDERKRHGTGQREARVLIEAVNGAEKWAVAVHALEGCRWRNGTLSPAETAVDDLEVTTTGLSAACCTVGGYSGCGEPPAVPAGGLGRACHSGPVPGR